MISGNNLERIQNKRQDYWNNDCYDDRQQSEMSKGSDGLGENHFHPMDVTGI